MKLLKNKDIDRKIVNVLKILTKEFNDNCHNLIFSAEKGGNFKFFNYKLSKNNNNLDFFGEFYSFKFDLVKEKHNIFKRIQGKPICFYFKWKSKPEVKYIPKKLRSEEILKLFDFILNNFKLTGFENN